MPLVVLTIGHSNHPLDRFLSLLAKHEVEALVDIRRFPGSYPFTGWCSLAGEDVIYHLGPIV